MYDVSCSNCTYLRSYCYLRSERRKYYHHREKSRSEPQKYLTIIIDGMDQNKTSYTQMTKSTQNLWWVRTHLTGSLVHTKSEKGKLSFAFFDLLQWPHDSNLTIVVLINVLTQLCSKFETLPTFNLTIQVEKIKTSSYVLGFLALLHLMIFQKGKYVAIIL